MERVRKGKGLREDDELAMKECDVPQWYIDSCNTIKYMFPKAHAVAYVTMSVKIAYFKVHFPEAFYATYFTMKAEDFDADVITKGENSIFENIKILEAKGNDKKLYAEFTVKKGKPLPQKMLDLYLKKGRIIDNYKSLK